MNNHSIFDMSELLDIKKRFEELQNKYQAYLPKVDPELIHDLLTRQQENPQVPHFLEMKNAYYDMLKKKLSSENDHVSQKAKFFLMCRSCFWCASILYEYLS